MSAGTFTFLHAADLHIDSPLRGLGRYTGAPEARIRRATRDAFTGLVDAAIEREVAFVILAGDVFDGDWKDTNTGLFFQEQLLRLTGAGIAVYLLRGNHDAASHVTREVRLPEGVHRFPESKPGSFVVESLGVALHGQGFAKRDVQENLSLGYPEPVPGAFNIGVLHTSLGGYEGHDTYAPASAADLADKGYDYWALGHVHGREVVRAEAPAIVYPGNLQGRHARETGPKGATLVTVAGGAIDTMEELVLDVVRWERIEVDVGGAADANAVLDDVRAALGRAAAACEGRLLAARVLLTGETPLDGELRVRSEWLEAEVQSAGLAADGDVWVETTRLETRAPAAERAETELGLGALAERVRAVALDDGERERLAEAVARLTRKLPPNLRAELDPGAMVDRVAPAAASLLAAHLAGAGGAGGAGSEPAEEGGPT